MNLVLIGFMGCGKTTLGRSLSLHSGYEFLDMDAEIERQAGMPITEIFHRCGEARFRELEHAFLQSLSAKENLILSTGGGIVLNPANMAILKQFGTVVFLSPPTDVLLKRLSDDVTRPLIAHKAPSEILELYRQRLPLYRQYADITLDGSENPYYYLKRLISKQ